SSAPFSYPRWPVSSACRPRSSAALTSAGTNPPSPVSSTFPASICSKRASSCPEAFSCSTKSWPVGSSGFFSSVMVMLLTVPPSTAYTDLLTRPNGTTPKTVESEGGPIELDVPRDRGGSFTPRLVPKGQRRLGGLDDMIIPPPHSGGRCPQPLCRWDDDPRYPASSSFYARH